MFQDWGTGKFPLTQDLSKSSGKMTQNSTNTKIVNFDQLAKIKVNWEKFHFEGVYQRSGATSKNWQA